MARFTTFTSANVLLFMSLGLFNITYRTWGILPKRHEQSLESGQTIPVVSDIAGLRAVPVGQRVLLAGRVGTNNPAKIFEMIMEYSSQHLMRQLVMYEVKKLDPASNSYTTSERLSPPFTFELADGSVQVVNSDYIVIDSWGWTSIGELRRARGIAVGQQAAISGKVIAVEGGIGIQANAVTNQPVDYFRVSHIAPDSRGWSQGFSALAGMAGTVTLLISFALGMVGVRAGRNALPLGSGTLPTNKHAR